MAQIRKMVLLRSHEWLEAGFAAQSMSASKDTLESQMQLSSGVQISDTIYPVKVPQGPLLTHEATGEVVGSAGSSFVVSAEFEDDSAEAEFVESNAEEVQGVYADPQISTCPVAHPTGPIGATADVLDALNIGALHGSNAQGNGVKIIVVDGGIDGTQINVVDGFSPRPGVSPGLAAPGHGTMVAFDCLIAAPNAMIFDYPLLTSTEPGWVGFLSDGIRAFSEVLTRHLQVPGPMVCVNSWALYDRSQDAPVGHPQNYSRNPTHPFNVMTGALATSGVDVLFAAGNCGAECPDERCGLSDRGPGESIHGANSHPAAFSVAGVTVANDRLCYSSQGPGGLNPSSPDISGFTHFSGSGVTSVDAGTSAACPVVAGVVAALRSTPTGRTLTTDQMKSLLISNTRSMHGSGWSGDFGWGIVDADAAFNALP